MRKILTWCCFIIVAIFTMYAGYYTASGVTNIYNFYKTTQNQEEQLEELYENQAFILSLIDNNYTNTQNEIEEIQDNLYDLREEIDKIKYINNTTSFILESQNKKINSQNIKIVDLAINLAEVKKEALINDALNIIEFKMEVVRPSYDYLESVTVYIFSKYSKDKGYIGTGVIVKQNSDFSYIMTNKHVCDKNDINTCNIVIYKYGESVIIPLKFVKQTESKYDIVLWKTSEYLPGKEAIKGLGKVSKSDKVYSVGNYLGYKYIYTEGTFAGYDNDGYFIFNLPCNRGCSGSGIYNKDGELVSLLFAVDYITIFQTETAKVIGIPSEIVRLFLRNLI